MSKKPKGESRERPLTQVEVAALKSCPHCGAGQLAMMQANQGDDDNLANARPVVLSPTPFICTSCTGLAVIDGDTGKPRGMPWRVFSQIPEEILEGMLRMAVQLRKALPRFWGPRGAVSELFDELCDMIDGLPEHPREIVLRNVIRADWVFQCGANEPTSAEGVDSAAMASMHAHYVVLRFPAWFKRKRKQLLAARKEVAS